MKKHKRIKKPSYPIAGSDLWLRKIKEALTHPGFKLQPPKVVPLPEHLILPSDNAGNFDFATTQQQFNYVNYYMELQK